MKIQWVHLCVLVCTPTMLLRGPSAGVACLAAGLSDPKSKRRARLTHGGTRKAGTLERRLAQLEEQQKSSYLTAKAVAREAARKRAATLRSAAQLKRSTATTTTASHAAPAAAKKGSTHAATLPARMTIVDDHAAGGTVQPAEQQHRHHNRHHGQLPQRVPTGSSTDSTTWTKRVREDAVGAEAASVTPSTSKAPPAAWQPPQAMTDNNNNNNITTHLQNLHTAPTLALGPLATTSKSAGPVAPVTLWAGDEWMGPLRATLVATSKMLPRSDKARPAIDWEARLQELPWSSDVTVQVRYHGHECPLILHLVC